MIVAEKSGRQIESEPETVKTRGERKAEQYIRIQLSLRPEYAKRLEALRIKLGLRSYAEVVRYCLRQTEQLVRIDPDADAELYLVHPDGTRMYIMR
jgi:hypothetical protein